MDSGNSIPVKILIFIIAVSAIFTINFYIESRSIQSQTSEMSQITTLDFLPKPNQDSNLILYSYRDENNYKFFTNQLTAVINSIETAPLDDIEMCSFYSIKNRASENKSCAFETLKLWSCNKNNNFGYHLAEPCILIKLKPILNWKPEPFGFDSNGQFSQEQLTTDLDTQIRENGMTEYFKYYNMTVANDKNDKDYRQSALETLWIDCQGSNASDNENLGPIEYYPMKGIPGYYYPFKNQSSYQEPFVFVQLRNPMKNVLIRVTCTGFAKNINPELSSTSFEIMIE